MICSLNGKNSWTTKVWHVPMHLLIMFILRFLLFIRFKKWGKNCRFCKRRNISSSYSLKKSSMRRKSVEERSKGKWNLKKKMQSWAVMFLFVISVMHLLLDIVVNYCATIIYFSYIILCNYQVYMKIVFFISSDITTLPSASYQTSLPLHSGQHLLSIQGDILKSLQNHNDLGSLLRK